MHRLPTTAQVNERLAAAQALKNRADHHIGVAQHTREQNRIALIIEKSLGLNGGGDK